MKQTVAMIFIFFVGMHSVNAGTSQTGEAYCDNVVESLYAATEFEPVINDTIEGRDFLGHDKTYYYALFGMNQNLKSIINRDSDQSILSEALIASVYSGNTEAFLFLLNMGASANSIGKESGSSVLMVAAQCGRNKMAGTLLRKGANPNFETNSGSNALIAAFVNRDKEMLLTLVKNGADVEKLADTPNGTLCEIAKKKEYVFMGSYICPQQNL